MLNAAADREELFGPVAYQKRAFKSEWLRAICRNHSAWRTDRPRTEFLFLWGAAIGGLCVSNYFPAKNGRIRRKGPLAYARRLGRRSLMSQGFIPSRDGDEAVRSPENRFCAGK